MFVIAVHNSHVTPANDVLAVLVVFCGSWSPGYLLTFVGVSLLLSPDSGCVCEDVSAMRCTAHHQPAVVFDAAPQPRLWPLHQIQTQMTPEMHQAAGFRVHVGQIGFSQGCE